MRNPKEQFEYLTKTPIPKLLFELSIPTIFSMLITSIYNLVDTFFVGQISTSASGAIGIVVSVMSIIQAIGFTFGHGAGGIVSRSLGAQEISTATRFTSTSFFSTIVVGGFISVFGLLFLSPFMVLLGSTPTILPHACSYAKYILFSAPIMMSSIVLNNILRYEGKANFAMVGLVSGGVINMALDPIFIFGFNMGTAGAGLATALSQVASFFLLLSPFLRGKTVSTISLRAVTRVPAEYIKIIFTGAPSFGRQGLASISGMILNIIASGYGDAAVAAMSIVNRIFTFLFSITVGIGQGLQPIAGFNYGAKKFSRVRRVALLMIVSASVVSVFLIAGCLSFATPLIRIFRDDPEVIAIALPAFRYQCLLCITLPTSTAANMLFQSIGKSGRATFLACCRQGVFFVPLVIIFPYCFGIFGLQIAQPIADFCTFITSILFLVPFLNVLQEAAKTREL